MKAPTVTLEQVLASIKGETYTVLPDGRTTICQLTMDNGFTVDGKSACVSKENFNEELGNKYSREAAVSKVWQFLGFRLADKLDAKTSDSSDSTGDVDNSYVGRMVQEWKDLMDKASKLDVFLKGETFLSLDPVDQDLLKEQYEYMCLYGTTLSKRLERARSK